MKTIDDLYESTIERALKDSGFYDEPAWGPILAPIYGPQQYPNTTTKIDPGNLTLKINNNSTNYTISSNPQTQTVTVTAELLDALQKSWGKDVHFIEEDKNKIAAKTILNYCNDNKMYGPKDSEEPFVDGYNTALSDVIAFVKCLTED